MADATYPIVKKPYLITENIDETKEVMVVRLKPEDNNPMNFDAGMFVMISGLDATGKEYVARALSVASEPASPVMEFFIIKEHDSHVSHFVEAKPGDRYNVKGPYGQFKFTPGVDKKVLFVAGGTGLAPFMSMIRHVKKIGAQDDMVLLYSIKYPTEIIRKEELLGYLQQLNLKVAITVTRPQPGDGWTGGTGHISADMVKKYALDFTERAVYICGPLAFVKAMKDIFVVLGVPNDRVKADVWG